MRWTASSRSCPARRHNHRTIQCSTTLVTITTAPAITRGMLPLWLQWRRQPLHCRFLVERAGHDDPHDDPHDLLHRPRRRGWSGHRRSGPWGLTGIVWRRRGRARRGHLAAPRSFLETKPGEPCGNFGRRDLGGAHGPARTHRQLLGFLRRPHVRARRDGRGRPGRRDHRRLPGRGHDAGARQEPAEKPGGGYASTFLRQLKPVLETVAERGIKVVVNAGGLDPAGLAAATRELLGRGRRRPLRRLRGGRRPRSRASPALRAARPRAGPPRHREALRRWAATR